jgi:hypothetical protein
MPRVLIRTQEPQMLQEVLHFPLRNLRLLLVVRRIIAIRPDLSGIGTRCP